jgi:polyisoprenoid-binding protein YceI
MDENTYEAMNSDDHPLIEYKLLNVGSIKMVDQIYVLSTNGNLKINGIIKPIKMEVKIKPDANHAKLTGIKKFKMSEYKIEPPTMFLGTITTGDEITIKFNLTIMFKEEQ